MIKQPPSRRRRRPHRPRHDIASIVYYVPEIATVGPLGTGRHSLGYFLYTRVYDIYTDGISFFMRARYVILTPPSSAFFLYFFRPRRP